MPILSLFKKHLSKIRQPKINRRKRYAEWVAQDRFPPYRANLWKASRDVKWHLIKEWAHTVSAGEISDRLKMSHANVIKQLQYALTPSQRVRTQPPCRSEQTVEIETRRKLVDKLAQVLEGTYVKYPTAPLIAEEIERRTRKCWDASTINRDLHALGYRLVPRPCSGQSKAEYNPFTRKVCCQNLLQCVDLKKLIFTDEKYFDSNDHGCRSQYVKPGQKVLPRVFTQFCVTAHFWGAIGEDFKLLIELPPSYGGLKATSSDYIQEVLEKFVQVVKSDKYKDRAYVLQQDGLPVHMSFETMGYLEGKGIDHLTKGQWPPWSADLSPIENIWSLLLHKMKAYKKKSGLTDDEKRKELSAHVWRAWHATTQAEINEYVRSAPGRIQECIDRDGEWTNH